MRMSRTISLAALISLLAACGANENILKSGKETPAPPSADAPAISTMDRDLEEMRTADFAFVYVLRRKDGGVIDRADKDVVRLHTANVNRRVLSDGDKALLIGSNYAIPPGDMAALNDRFAIEDHSTSPAPDVNSNQAAPSPVGTRTVNKKWSANNSRANK